jgi:hypothetical protein
MSRPVTLKEYLFLTDSSSKDSFELDSLLSSGNLKVPSSTAIFNMGSATDCPSRKLGLCQVILNGKCHCYALKSECLYPLVLPHRRLQEHYWKRVSVERFCSEFLAINSLKTEPFTALRFNESGDFWSQSCVNKAERIACILSRFGIKTYCYTSRSDLDFSSIRHLIISGSGFRKDGITNEFRMIYNLSERPRGFGICPMNCSKCTRCLVRGLSTVVVKH